MPDHVWEWKSLWLRARTSTLPDRSAREAFELLRTALVYHRNALDDYSTDSLHARFRLEHARLTTDNSLLEVEEPLFRSPLPQGTVGGMHIASASLRLPSALLRTFDVRPAARRPFEQSAGLSREMLKKDNSDWERAGFPQFFDVVKGLDHCETGSLGTGNDELRHAIVMVLVHRDDFSHGEEGKSDPKVKDLDRKRYIDERESVLDSLYTCRIFEAQRALIRWCLINLFPTSA